MTPLVLILLLSAPAADAFVTPRVTFTPALAAYPKKQPTLQASSSSSNLENGTAPPTPSSSSDDSSALTKSASDISEASRNAAQNALAFVQDLKNFNKTAVVENLETIFQNVMEGETGRRGEVYFAIQVVLGLCILGGGIPFVGGFVSVLFGPILMLSGLAASVLSASKLGRALSPWPVPNENTDTLLKTGLLYGQVRHPIYAGLLAAATGFSVWTESAFRLLLTAALWYLLDLKADYEEEAMVQRFGAEYQEYQTRVTNKFFPQILLDLLPWNKKQDNILPPGDAGDFQ